MRDVAVLLLIIGLVPVILRKPWIGIIAWFVISLLNPHKLTWGFAQELPVANVVGLATLAGLLVTKEKRAVALSPEMILLLLFAAFVTLTTIFSWNPQYAWAQWWKVLKIYLMVFVTSMLIFGQYRIKALFYTVAGCLAFFGLKGGVFSILGGGQQRVQGHAGFMNGNTDLGLGMAMALPLIYAVAAEQPSGWRRWAGWGTFWLTVIATIFTYSRGAWLGLAAVMALLFFYSKRKLLIVSCILPLMIAAVPFIPEQVFNRADTIESFEQDHSSMMRIQAWGVAFNVAKSNPLGAGFAIDFTPNERWLSYASFLGEWYNQTRSAHSIYFQVLGEHGFVGLALFVSMLVMTFITLGRVKASAKRAGPAAGNFAAYAGALQIGLVGYCVSGAFLNLAYFDMLYLYMILGAVMIRDLTHIPAHGGIVSQPGGSRPQRPSSAEQEGRARSTLGVSNR